MLQIKAQKGQVLSKHTQMNESSCKEGCPRLNWQSPELCSAPYPSFTAAAKVVVVCFVFVKLCNL